MLQWLWLLAIPFIAAVLLPFQPIIIKVAGFGGMLVLAAWGCGLYIRLNQIETRSNNWSREAAEAREEINRQKAAGFDLSQQKEKLEVIRKDQEQRLSGLKTILDGLPAAVLVVNKKDDRVVWCNLATEKITGYKIDELMGQGSATLFHGSPMVVPSKNRMDLLTGSKTAELDRDKITDKSGKELEVSSHLWAFDSGDRTGWMFIPKPQAEDYNKLRDEFVTNISHELRTPLTVIKGYAEILYEEAKTAESPQADLMKVIVDEGERLAGILDSILNFRQASSGMLGLRDEKVDIIALISTVVHDIEPKAVKKNIKISQKVPASLSPSRGDFNALRFALSNIVDNAVKFTPENGSVTVETGGWRLEDAMWKMEIHVTDTGVGIAPEVLPHIFEKFYRTDQKVHTLQGTGIGLSLTKEILETHGGSIHVESTVGKGTRVTMGLPMSE
jgi:PAS domain S-box-containing protein